MCQCGLKLTDCILCCRSSRLPSAQDVNAAQEAGAAGSSEHRQLCKQLAAALCSLAEMQLGLAEDVSAVSGSS